MVAEKGQTKNAFRGSSENFNNLVRISYHFYLFIFLTILHIFFMRTFNSLKTSEFSEFSIFEAEIWL